MKNHGSIPGGHRGFLLPASSSAVRSNQPLRALYLGYSSCEKLRARLLQTPKSSTHVAMFHKPIRIFSLVLQHRVLFKVSFRHTVLRRHAFGELEVTIFFLACKISAI